MLRRPNRASWNEESAGRPSPLAQLLASPQPLHPFHADNSFVGSRHDLPGQIGFGAMHPHPVSGTEFTGAHVASPQTGHGQGAPQMPSFSQANSHAGSSVAASLAALGLLTGTPHGGGATPTLPPPPTPPVRTAAPPPVQPPMTTGLRVPDFSHGPVDRTFTPDPRQPATGLGPVDRTAPLDPSRQPAIGGGPADRTDIAGALSQLLTSIGRRGVYNV